MISDLRKMKFCLSIVICLILFAVSLIVAVAEEPEYRLRFGGSDVVGGLEDQSNMMFIELVERKSDGRIKIDYFPADQLGADREQIEGMQVGSQDFLSNPVVWYSSLVKDLWILSFGYIFRDREHVDKFLKSSIFEEMKEELVKNHGIRILAAGHRTPRVLFCRKPIFGLEDLKGMKMRCPAIEAFVLLWETLGTKPTQTTWGESYLALRQGVADGIEASVGVCYQSKHHEVCPYLMLTDHMMDIQHIAMRDATYQALPTDLQKVVLEAAQESMDWYAKAGDESEEEIIKKMIQEGTTVIRFNLEPWREKVAKKIEELEAKEYWSKGLYERINQIK